MANIKDLKKKIKTTKSTLKITSAMKLVAAAKLNRAQVAITNARPYANELEETIKVVSALVENYAHPYLEENDSKKTLLLVISANKGLCGGYNTQLAKAVKNYLHENAGEDLEVCYIGKKVRDVVKGEVNNNGETFEFAKSEASFAELQSIANTIAARFESGEIGKIVVAYNVFKSAISFVPTFKQLLPMELDKSAREEIQEKYPFDFLYSPEPKVILDSLIPETYVNTLYTCLLDAVAAEHGARMTAMDSAVTNCNEAIRSLTLTMNKLRQGAITTELNEVVSGAESLNG